MRYSPSRDVNGYAPVNEHADVRSAVSTICSRGTAIEALTAPLSDTVASNPRRDRSSRFCSTAIAFKYGLTAPQKASTSTFEMAPLRCPSYASRAFNSRSNAFRWLATFSKSTEITPCRTGSLADCVQQPALLSGQVLHLSPYSASPLAVGRGVD